MRCRAPPCRRRVTGSQIAKACAAALDVEFQTKRLALEQRRGALISRDGTTWVRPSHPSARSVYHCPSVRDSLDAWALPRSSRLAGTPEADELLEVRRDAVGPHREDAGE